MRRPHFLLFLLPFGLAACGQRPTPPMVNVVIAAPLETETPFPTEPRTPLPTWTLPFEPSPTPTVAPTPTALPPVATATPIVITCAETQGTVERISVPSPTLGYAIDALLYLPPCYYSSFDYYPVLYLIHGLDYSENQWDRIGAPAAADALIAAEEIAPLIIVMPRDRLDDRLDPALVDDLAPYIDGNYRTKAQREYRAIGGLSRGGAWAIHLGLHYPEVFSRIGAHSPAIFYGDDENVLYWARHLPPDMIPAVYIDIGQGDSLLGSAAWFDQVLTWFGVEHTYLVQSGAHNEKYWSAHVAEYLRFYAAGWRFALEAAPPPDVGDSNLETAAP